VSPANILVGYDGQVKVADFGIAKAALRTVETQTGTLKGKVSYMSPEQVTGRPVDRRSDVYALGIVLYEVVTARRLFKGDNDFMTMSSIVQGDIPLPSLLRPDLPRILEDIVMKALSQSPKDRYQSAEELRAELEKFTHAIGMRMSNESIADYMRKLFGVRAQPWLTDTEPTHTTTIDFDGSASGLVQPSAAAVQRNALPTGDHAASNSPIAMSRRVATPRPIADADAASAGAAAENSWVAKPPTGTGSGQPLAWSQQQPPRRAGGSGSCSDDGRRRARWRPDPGPLDDERRSTGQTRRPALPRRRRAAPPRPTTPRPTTPRPTTPRPTTPRPTTPRPTTPRPTTPRPRRRPTLPRRDGARNEGPDRGCRGCRQGRDRAKAADDANAAKAEAARLAKADAAAKAETAAKAAEDAKAAKVEAARLARAEKAEKAEAAAKAAAAARAEKAEAARLARAEKAEAARLAKAASVKAAASKPKTDPVASKATKPATTKPATAKPKTDEKWDPNSLFPK